MKKVYIFLADGFEEVEGLTVVDLLRRAGIETCMVSITGTKEITGSHNIRVIADQLFEETDYNDAKMLILPGGMPGTKHLGEHKGLVNLLCEFHKKGNLISAICAAPSVLGKNHILQGRKVTSFPGYEDQLIGAEYTGNKVEKDSNIITSKGLGTALDFSLAIIETIINKETADKIAASIQYI
ncbi:MAG: hypothetical protein K0R21_245 [Anaerocolumna sp.]|jgi:4-methyl-5(b-hydroxyethyl)-thiazole monophosphate biosynthesis|nr:hypothetical protein [Anaerocolumna sp.]